MYIHVIRTLLSVFDGVGPCSEAGNSVVSVCFLCLLADSVKFKILLLY